MKSKALRVVVLLSCMCVLTGCSHGVESNKGTNQPVPVEKSEVTKEDSQEINYDKLSDGFICKDSILLGELYRRVQYKQWDLTDDQLKNFNPRYLMKCILDKHFKGEVEYWIGPKYADDHQSDEPGYYQKAFNVVIKKHVSDNSLQTLKSLIQEFGLQSDFHNPYQKLVPKPYNGVTYTFYMSDTQRFKPQSLEFLWSEESKPAFSVSDNCTAIIFDDNNNAYIMVSEVSTDALPLEGTFETGIFENKNDSPISHFFSNTSNTNVTPVYETSLED